jgi:3-deoxy-D-manno-octulosonate 8-phosphate phosphatase (KDO 8-P phosphatase)
MSNFKEDLTKVKAFAFDIDGVFTDGSVYTTAEGDQIRATNTKDGFAVRYALKMGYPIGIISAGRFNEGVTKRLKSLEVEDLYMGSFEKTDSILSFCKKHSVDLDQVLYMGDDIPDYPVLKMVGVPTCPADSVEEVKQVSKYISNYKGGRGCVRDVIEQVLRAQGKWVKLDSGEKEIL